MVLLFSLNKLLYLLEGSLFKRLNPPEPLAKTCSVQLIFALCYQLYLHQQHTMVALCNSVSLVHTLAFSKSVLSKPGS